MEPQLFPSRDDRLNLEDTTEGSRAPRKMTIRNMAYYSKFAFQPGPRNGLALNPSSTIPCLPYPRASRKDIQVWSWWMVESGRSPAAGLKVPQRGGEGREWLFYELRY